MSQTTVKYSNPPGLARPLGAYSHIARASASELVFIAGQLAVNEAGELVGKADFAVQMRQVFGNLARALESEGLGFAQRDQVHNLPRAFPGYRKLHGGPQGTFRHNLSGRQIPTKYLADSRSVGR